MSKHTSTFMKKVTTSVIIVLTVLLSTAFLTQIAQADVDSYLLRVTTFEDLQDAVPGDGVCQTTRNNCSLRAALQEANAHENFNEIVLDSGTYPLTIHTSDPKLKPIVINHDVKIVGTGNEATRTLITYAGNAPESNQLIHAISVADSATLELIDMLVELQGYTGDSAVANGSVINNYGNLSVTSAYILPQAENRNNRTAAITNSGSLYANQMHINDSPQRYAIINESGYLNITSSDFRQNTSGFLYQTGKEAETVLHNVYVDRQGSRDEYKQEWEATIYNEYGSITAKKLFLQENINFKDIITNHEGILTIQNSKFLGNASIKNSFLKNTGTTIIDTSDFFANNAQQSIIENKGSLRISESLFNNSSTRTDKSGVIDNFGETSVSYSGFVGNLGINGGGLANHNVMSIKNSSILKNTASEEGGGVFQEKSIPGIIPSLRIVNTVIGENEASLYGGGVANRDGELVLQNVTIHRNHVKNNSGHEASGGGLFSNVTVRSELSLFSRNYVTSKITTGMPSSAVRFDNCDGTRVSPIRNNTNAVNMLDVVGSCIVEAYVLRNPDLQPLHNFVTYSESNITLPAYPILRNSPVRIEVKNDEVYCPIEDMRGIVRNDDMCDIGALEYRKPVMDIHSPLAGTYYKGEGMEVYWYALFEPYYDGEAFDTTVTLALKDEPNKALLQVHEPMYDFGYRYHLWVIPETLESRDDYVITITVRHTDDNSIAVQKSSEAFLISAPPTPTPAPPTPTPAPPTPTPQPEPVMKNVEATVKTYTDIANQDGTDSLDIYSGKTPWDIKKERWIGTGSDTENSYLGLRFTELRIPENATITSAKLVINNDKKDQWISTAFIARGEKNSNPQQFTNEDLPSERTTTQSSTTYKANEKWQKGTDWEVDVTDIAQEVYEDSGSIDTMALILHGEGSSYGRKFINITLNGEEVEAPVKLVVEYEVLK
ncbi:MAG: hypothetical protein ACOCXT_03750 [Candidatus Dojkabacteria bacterium]